MKENPLPLMNEGLGELRVSKTLFCVKIERMWREPPKIYQKFDKQLLLCYNATRNKLVTFEIKCLKTQHKCNTYRIR